jgi:hypothetical protein
MYKKQLALSRLTLNGQKDATTTAAEKVDIQRSTKVSSKFEFLMKF